MLATNTHSSGLTTAQTSTPTSQVNSSTHPTAPSGLSAWTSSSGYVFPPIWSFPPFFTQQPNPETCQHQTNLWTNLILSWARFHRVFEIAVDGGSISTGTSIGAELNGVGENAGVGTATRTGTRTGGRVGVWENERIKRKVGRDFARVLMDALVRNGQASVISPVQTSKTSREHPTAVLLYWLKPDEWASILYSWIVATGQTKSILTFYDLQSSETGSPVHDLPLPLLRSALQILIKQNKAQVFKSTGEDGETDGEGVKFV
ncbi:Uncharacterized conserved protein [Phaffia rhodozyma]|uniref:Uncharacterized conserved protein n=1 Tax=Phaffia rhodozyma TaxID=264483 RepID=A0A0F7SG98_PHARH|nr:Uncharacterized conserved protein [Phaffia rhodozyma]